MHKNRTLLVEIWDFLKVKKAWWLIPPIIIFILADILIILGSGSSMVPPNYLCIVLSYRRNAPDSIGG